MLQRLSALNKFSGTFGVILGLLGALSFSWGSFLVKSLNNRSNVESFSIAATRQTFLFFFAAPQVAAFKAPFLPQKADLPFLLTRSLFGGISVTLIIISLSYLPLADTGVIVATAPTFTSLLGWLVLREKLSISDLIILPLTFIGVVFILRPPFLFGNAVTSEDSISTTNRMIGCSLAAIAALSQAGIYVSVRKLRHLNYAFLSMFYGIASGPLLVGICLSVHGYSQSLPPCDYVSKLTLVGIAMTAIVGQCLQTLAAKFVTAGVVSLTRSAEVLFSFVWQLLLLSDAIDQSISIFSIYGCLFVLTAVCILSLRPMLVHFLKTKTTNSNENGGNCFIHFLLVIFQ